MTPGSDKRSGNERAADECRSGSEMQDPSMDAICSIAGSRGGGGCISMQYTCVPTVPIGDFLLRFRIL